MSERIQACRAEVDAGNKAYYDLVKALPEEDQDKKRLHEHFRDSAYPNIASQMREAEDLVENLQKRIEVYRKWQKGEEVGESETSWMERSPARTSETEPRKVGSEEEAADEASENVDEGNSVMTLHEVSTPQSDSQESMDALRQKLADISSISSPPQSTVTTTKIQLTPTKVVAQHGGTVRVTADSPEWPAWMTHTTAASAIDSEGLLFTTPVTCTGSAMFGVATTTTPATASTGFGFTAPATCTGSATFGLGAATGFGFTAPATCTGSASSFLGTATVTSSALRGSTVATATSAQALPLTPQSQTVLVQAMPKPILKGGSRLQPHVTFSGVSTTSQSMLSSTGGTGLGATFGSNPAIGHAAVSQPAPPMSQYATTYLQPTMVSMPPSQAPVASQPTFGYSVGMTPTTGGQWVYVGAGSTQQPTYIPTQGVYTVPPPQVLQQSAVPAQMYTVPPQQLQQQSAATAQWTSPSLTPDIPKLQLPVFNGKRSEFRSFWQLFEETVHLKAGVSNAYKMLYLRNLLQGEPEELVKAYGVDGAYYEAAVASLKEKYGDQAKLLNELHAEFDRIAPSGDSVSSARSTFTRIEILCRQMEAAGQDLDQPQDA